MRRWLMTSFALPTIFLTYSATAPAAETKTFTYDALGQMVLVQSSGGRSNSLCYDPAGNRTRYKSDSAGSVAPCTPTPGPTPTPTPGPTPTPTSAPTINISDALGVEAHTLTFTVTLTSASSATVSVNYATATGTAVANDFTAASGTLSFSPGQTSKTIVIATNTDAKPESDEYFYINLTSPTNATIGDAQGKGTIQDDGNGGCQTC